MRLKIVVIATAVLIPLLGFSSVNVVSASTPQDTVVAVGQGTFNPPIPAGGSDGVTVAGQGTIIPGIPATGCATSAPHVTFDGSGVVVGPDAQLASVHFEGDSTSGCAGAISDSGSGVLSGTASGTVNFSRTGAVLTLSGAVAINGTDYALSAVCQFNPTSANPTNSYALTCQAMLGSTSGCASGVHVKFGATGTVVGPDAQLGALNFEGDSTTDCATSSSDSGSGVLSGSVSGSVSYSRTDTVVTLTGTGSTIGGKAFAITAVCQIYPTSGSSWTSYVISCQGTLSS